MKISEMKSHDAVRLERRATDPVYAAEADGVELGQQR